ncbi:hypothetical protein C8Q79DRAFT_948897 [Trametes meyenii]|nr:hypothetical protein C8Q79DRAFT_948897 [Trametes meyenii]
MKKASESEREKTAKVSNGNTRREDPGTPLPQSKGTAQGHGPPPPALRIEGRNRRAWTVKRAGFLFGK